MRVDVKRLAAIAIGAVAVLLLFHFFDPPAWRIYPVCIFHAYTGLNCPGCGTSRALRALAQGNVGDALHFNALMLFLLPIFVYLAVRRDTTTIKAGWIWLLVGVVIAFGILRNIPVYPFTLLSPPS